MKNLQMKIDCRSGWCNRVWSGGNKQQRSGGFAAVLLFFPRFRGAVLSKEGSISC